MDQNYILHLTVEMDLQVDAVCKNYVNLEKTLDWVKIRDDAALRGIHIGIDAPTCCFSDGQIFLPNGFLACKCKSRPSGSASPNRELYEVVHTGDPFTLVQNEDDILELVTSLLNHTSPLDFTLYGFVIPADSCLEQVLQKSESFLLQACCYYLQSECPKEDFHLCSVAKLLRTSEDDSVDRNVTSIMDILFHDLELREPEHPAVSAYTSFKTGGGQKIAEVVLASCIHRLEHLSLLDLNEIVSDMETVSHTSR